MYRQQQADSTSRRFSPKTGPLSSYNKPAYAYKKPLYAYNKSAYAGLLQLDKGPVFGPKRRNVESAGCCLYMFIV